MDTLTFRKERAAELLESILLRKPLVAPGDGWTQDELLQLSAAAILVASMHIPFDTNDQLEYVEAKAQTSFDDCFTAVEFYADLTTMVRQNLFDEQFEPVVKAKLVRDGDDRAIRIVSGNHH